MIQRACGAAGFVPSAVAESADFAVLVAPLGSRGVRTVLELSERSSREWVMESGYTGAGGDRSVTL